jgi:regulator of sigma E protease
VARRCGVKVLRFSVGFGRPIARWVRGADRTDWTIGALPLGGYVRMLDERDPECQPIAAADLPRAFNRQSVWRRIAIVLAGPLANLILAVAIYWVLLVMGAMEPRALMGAPQPNSAAARAGVQAGDLVVGVAGQEVRSFRELSWLLVQRVGEPEVAIELEQPSGARRETAIDLSGLHPDQLEQGPLGALGLRPYTHAPRIERVTPGGAAEAAGLQAGDVVLAVEGLPLAGAAALIERVRASAGRPLELRVQRGASELQLRVTPAAVSERDGAAVGRIGAELNDRPSAVLVRYGPLESVGLALRRTGETISFSLRMLGKMVTGEASWKNLSGPVTIADYAGQTARTGLSSYLAFLALVSISLGVLNLLPIPMLDGGHLLYYSVEIIKGSPPADWIVEWGQRAGIAVLVGLTMLALYNDFVRLLT